MGKLQKEVLQYKSRTFEDQFKIETLKNKLKKSQAELKETSSFLKKEQESSQRLFNLNKELTSKVVNID